MERTTTLFVLVYCCFVVATSTTAAQTNGNLITTAQSALLALKSHITSDPHNSISTNWSTNSPVRYWVGVTCNVRHLRVAALNLSYYGLAGTIPPQLGNLSFLVELSFSNNSFHGTLPPELGRLRRLKFIGLKYNNFEGIIPSWLGSLSRLQTINLQGNKFSGSVPAAMFNLSALQIIDLSSNQLSGSIPREIGNLTMLKKIILDSNKFKELPNEIGSLDQLEKFVQFNSLQGHVLVALFNMSSLPTLALWQNNLSGSLPENICQHLPNIQALDLGRNKFDGPLSSKWSHCKQLRLLDLAGNSLRGTSC